MKNKTEIIAEMKTLREKLCQMPNGGARIMIATDENGEVIHNGLYILARFNGHGSARLVLKEAGFTTKGNHYKA